VGQRRQHRPQPDREPDVLHRSGKPGGTHTDLKPGAGGKQLRALSGFGSLRVADNSWTVRPELPQAIEGSSTKSKWQTGSPMPSPRRAAGPGSGPCQPRLSPQCPWPHQGQCGACPPRPRHRHGPQSQPVPRSQQSRGHRPRATLRGDTDADPDTVFAQEPDSPDRNAVRTWCTGDHGGGNTRPCNPFDGLPLLRSCGFRLSRSRWATEPSTGRTPPIGRASAVLMISHGPILTCGRCLWGIGRRSARCGSGGMLGNTRITGRPSIGWRRPVGAGRGTWWRCGQKSPNGPEMASHDWIEVLV